jgi:hypothetical protein
LQEAWDFEFDEVGIYEFMLAIIIDRLEWLPKLPRPLGELCRLMLTSLKTDQHLLQNNL